MAARTWDVLLICGPSGAGKSSLSYPLALRHEVALAEVDDIVEALKAVTTSAVLPALHFWDTHPEAQQMSAGAIVAQGRDVQRELEPAIIAVIENHLETAMPVIIEGDFLDPSLAARFGSRVRAIVIVDDEVQVVANYPGAGTGRRTTAPARRGQRRVDSVVHRQLRRRPDH